MATDTPDEPSDTDAQVQSLDEHSGRDADLAPDTAGIDAESASSEQDPHVTQHGQGGVSGADAHDPSVDGATESGPGDGASLGMSTGEPRVDAALSALADADPTAAADAAVVAAQVHERLHAILTEQ